MAIPSNEIEAIRRAVESGANVSPHPFLKCGERVRVKCGPLTGVEGILVRVKNQCRLVVSVEMLGKAVAVEVDAYLVEKASGNRPNGSITNSQASSLVIRDSIRSPQVTVNLRGHNRQNIMQYSSKSGCKPPAPRLARGSVMRNCLSLLAAISLVSFSASTPAQGLAPKNVKADSNKVLSCQLMRVRIRTCRRLQTPITLSALRMSSPSTFGRNQKSREPSLYAWTARSRCLWSMTFKLRG